MSSLSLWWSVLWLLLPPYALSLCSAVACVRLCVGLRQAGWLSPLLSRKAMHVLTGPAFLCLWALYPSYDPNSPVPPSPPLLLASSLSPYVAASIPLCSALYFLSVGLGLVKDEGLVQAVARRGGRVELLAGPCVYGLVHSLSCAGYWTTSPVGAFLILNLCVGDGLADIAGRWAKTQPTLHRPLPWNADKTAVGSVTMLASSLLSIGLFTGVAGMWGKPSFSFFSLPSCSGWSLLQCAALLSLVCCGVESLPLRDWDNLTTFTGGVLASLIWPCQPCSGAQQPLTTPHQHSHHM